MAKLNQKELNTIIDSTIKEETEFNPISHTTEGVFDYDDEEDEKDTGFDYEPMDLDDDDDEGDSWMYGDGEEWQDWG